MTYKEKKELLESYRWIKCDIAGLENEYREWFTVATHITQTLSFTPISHNATSKVENSAIKMNEILDNITEEQKNAIAKKEKIEKAISTITKSNQRKVIEMRYIRFMKLDDIADEIGITSRAVRSLIKRAILSMRI